MKQNKVIKVLIRVLLVLLAAVVLFVSGMMIDHFIRSAHEKKVLSELGYYDPVQTGDHCINLARFGNRDGKHRIVAMSGLGNGDFAVTGRQMTKWLEEDNEVIFIDRAGYGLSDDTGDEMTLEYIVEDYRRALKNGGVEGPYVLMAHSIGGAYATYWESMYPDEVDAVVFVDGSQLSEDVFEGREDGDAGFGDRFTALMAKAGFARLVIRDYYYRYPDNYNDEEQWLGDALNLMTADSVAPKSESYLAKRNAQEAYRQIRTNDIPKLYICASWGFDTAQYEQKRQDVIYPYAERLGNCKVELLPGDHMIYEQKPDECGKMIKEFLDGL